jgi:NTE family protein
MAAAGLTPSEIKDRLCGLKRQDFWDPGLGVGLLKGHKMHALLEELLFRPSICIK